MLYYKTAGSGDTTVFLHGFLESGDIWDQMLPHLSESGQCLVLDLPGHGRSPYIDPDASIANMADSVRQILDLEGLNRVSFVGHSMGGYVALAFADQWPERVEKICLLNSHTEEDTPQKRETRTRVLDIVKQHYPVFVRESIPGLFSEAFKRNNRMEVQALIIKANKYDPSAIATCTLALRDRPDLTSRVDELGIPVHFIAGDEDPVLPLETVQKQVSQIQKASLSVVSGCGHMAWLEDQGKCEQLIRSFMETPIN